jgi:glycerol-3-phosphate acyltransferase PlsY
MFMNVVLDYVLPSIIAYLLGSISFSIIVTWLFSRKDIRTFGSGNAGGTNVLRVMGPLPGIITILGDVGKCILAVLVAKYFLPGGSNAIAMSLAGLFCVLGHMFPVYFGFKGGKGVASSAGMVLALDPRVFLILIAAFAITVIVTRYVSLGSIVGAVAFPFGMFIFYDNMIVTIAALIIASLVIFMHRKNIHKLLSNTENKLTFKKSK